MRRFEELPLEDGLALIDMLIEQGLITEDRCVTPLGEEYIASGRDNHAPFNPVMVNAWQSAMQRYQSFEELDEDDEFDTRPLADLTNTDSIIKNGHPNGEA